MDMHFRSNSKAWRRIDTACAQIDTACAPAPRPTTVFVADAAGARGLWAGKHAVREVGTGAFMMMI